MPGNANTNSATFLAVLQTLAEECWYMFLCYNHAHFDRRYVMNLVIHYQFVAGYAKQLCQLLDQGQEANDGELPKSLQSRILFYLQVGATGQQELCHLPYHQALLRATNELQSHESLVQQLQDASKIEFVPSTDTESLIHKTMLETTTITD